MPIPVVVAVAKKCEAHDDNKVLVSDCFSKKEQLRWARRRILATVNTGNGEGGDDTGGTIPDHIRVEEAEIETKTEAETEVIVRSVIYSSDRSDNNNNNNNRSERRKHLWSSIGLCGCALSMFYLITNVIPYSGFFALHLLNNEKTNKNNNKNDDDTFYYTVTNIGPYAGIITSAFQLGRVTTSILWGNCADKYGRKFVLVTSQLAIIITNICFGLSTNYNMAVVTRFIGGVFTATMGITRTSISEIAKGNSELETKGVGLLFSMIGYGTLIGPSIGGFLSEPLVQYPDIFEKSFHSPFWTNIFETYPFLLPNLFGSFFSIIALLIVLTSVEETLPAEQCRDWKLIPKDVAIVVCKFIAKCVVTNMSTGSGESVWTMPISMSMTRTEKSMHQTLAYDGGNNGRDQHLENEQTQILLQNNNKNYQSSTTRVGKELLIHNLSPSNNMNKNNSTNDRISKDFTVSSGFSTCNEVWSESEQLLDSSELKRTTLLLVASKKNRDSLHTPNCLPHDSVVQFAPSIKNETKIYHDVEENNQDNNSTQCNSRRSSSSSSKSTPFSHKNQNLTSALTLDTSFNTAKHKIPPYGLKSRKTLADLDASSSLVEVEPPPSSKISDIMSPSSNVRFYLYSFWCYSFTTVARSETLSLFAMASPMKGGLGMNETSIGIVSTISGLFFIIGQYTTYIFLLKTIGFMKSLRYGALFCILPIILIPFSLYFPKTKNKGAVGIDDDNDNDGTMNWYQLLYLGSIKGFCSIMGSVFSGCATIGANRSIVHPSQRAYMNGVSSMGSSIGRGLGPIFAGVFMVCLRYSAYYRIH